MKIEINEQDLAKIFASGLIHPSDVKCLNQESKQALMDLCLQLCQPNNCQNCDRQNICNLTEIKFQPEAIKTASKDLAI